MREEGSHPFPLIRLRLVPTRSLLPPYKSLIFQIRESENDRYFYPTLDILITVTSGIKAPMSHRVQRGFVQSLEARAAVHSERLRSAFVIHQDSYYYGSFMSFFTCAVRIFGFGAIGVAYPHPPCRCNIASCPISVSVADSSRAISGSSSKACCATRSMARIFCAPCKAGRARLLLRSIILVGCHSDAFVCDGYRGKITSDITTIFPLLGLIHAICPNPPVDPFNSFRVNLRSVTSLVSTSSRTVASTSIVQSEDGHRQKVSDLRCREKDRIGQCRCV